MSFDGYLNTIRERTGLAPEDFVRLASERGLVGPALKAADVVAWLAADYGLGRGHAMAIVAVLKDALPADAHLDTVFRGVRQTWRPTYDRLWSHVQALGTDTGAQPTKQYVSFTRDGRKFAIVQPTGNRLDVGLKLDPNHDEDGLEPAGTWNSMVTHRVQVHDDAQVDDRLIALIDAAYERAGR